MDRECYTFKLWGKCLLPFLELSGGPVWRTRIEGKRWLYAYYGCYRKPEGKRALKDKFMLNRLGFKRVELVKQNG